VSREYFTNRLSPMASIAYQQRYGVDALKDEYLLLDEVLEGVGECIRAAAFVTEASASLSPVERESILALDSFYRGLKTPLSWADAFANPQWISLREASAKVLAVMRFDIASWERAELGSVNR